MAESMMVKINRVWDTAKNASQTIPFKFYNQNAEGYPVVINTVGELIEALKELPSDLEVNQDYSSLGGAQVVVFNINEDRHLCLVENEQYDNDEQDLDED